MRLKIVSTKENAQHFFFSRFVANGRISRARRTKEARGELRSLVVSADAAAGCSSVRKRAGMAKTKTRRAPVGSRGGSRELAMEKDPEGEVRKRGTAFMLINCCSCPQSVPTTRRTLPQRPPQTTRPSVCVKMSRLVHTSKPAGLCALSPFLRWRTRLDAKSLQYCSVACRQRRK